MCCALSTLSAQAPEAGETRVLKLTPSQAATVHIDGLLSEAFWQRAAVIGDLRQQEPDEGAPATEKTEVRVAVDGDNVYVGVMAFDRDPNGIVSRILRRDQIMDFRRGELQFAGDDAVAILFDTFHDSRNAFVFATNPNGAEFEALVTDEGSEVNIDWRAVWDVAATRNAQGWSAEFSIPLRTLRYPEDGSGVWGFNVYRTIRRKNEMVLWRSWSRDNEGFLRVSRAGLLQGMNGLPGSGLNLEVKPFVLGGARQELDANGETPISRESDVGLDLKSQVSQGLVFDLTLNTDFAQVEVDDEQVNLTRFSLFFPEKRDFFLENAGIFDVGLRGGFGPPPYQLFFSRRIGIGEEGPIPILGGARLTGRAGGQTLGLMNVVTAENDTVPVRSFSVARIKRDIGENNYLGAMVTDRRDTDGWNTVAAADGSFWLRPTMNVKGFISQSLTSGAGGDGRAYSATAEYRTDLVGATFEHLTVEPDAQADLGFITRTDIRQTRGEVVLSPRPHWLGIRYIDHRLEGEYISTTDWRMQDWTASLLVSPHFESGDWLGLDFNVGESQLDEGFRLADSIPVEVGRYDVTGVRLFAGTAPQRMVVGGLRGSWGHFYGGTHWSVEPSITLAPSPQVNLRLQHQWDRVEIPNGDLTSNVTSLRFGYAFSTKLTTNALLQYNSVDRRLSANLRLDFIHRPGSDLFIVLTEDRGVEDRLWALSNRGVVVKVTYLARM